MSGASHSGLKFVDPTRDVMGQRQGLSSPQALLDQTTRDVHTNFFDQIEQDLRASKDAGLGHISGNLRIIDLAEEKALKAIFEHASDPQRALALYEAGQRVAKYGVADIAVALSELRYNGGNPELCDKLEKELCDLVLRDKLGDKSGFSASYVGNTHRRVQTLIKKVNDQLDVVLDKKDIFQTVLNREVLPAIRDHLEARLGTIDDASWQEISAARGIASRAAAEAADRMTEKLKTFTAEGSHTALHAKVNQWRVAQHWAELMRAINSPQAKERSRSERIPEPEIQRAEPLPVPATQLPSAAVAPLTPPWQWGNFPFLNLNINGVGKSIDANEKMAKEVVKKILTTPNLSPTWLDSELRKCLSSEDQDHNSHPNTGGKSPSVSSPNPRPAGSSSTSLFSGEFESVSKSLENLPKENSLDRRTEFVRPEQKNHGDDNKFGRGNPPDGDLSDFSAENKPTKETPVVLENQRDKSVTQSSGSGDQDILSPVPKTPGNEGEGKETKAKQIEKVLKEFFNTYGSSATSLKHQSQKHLSPEDQDHNIHPYAAGESPLASSPNPRPAGSSSTSLFSGELESVSESLENLPKENPSDGWNDTDGLGQKNHRDVNESGSGNPPDGGPSDFSGENKPKKETPVVFENLRDELLTQSSGSGDQGNLPPVPETSGNEGEGKEPKAKQIEKVLYEFFNTPGSSTTSLKSQSRKRLSPEDQDHNIYPYTAGDNENDHVARGQDNIVNLVSIVDPERIPSGRIVVPVEVHASMNQYDTDDVPEPLHTALPEIRDLEDVPAGQGLSGHDVISLGDAGTTLQGNNDENSDAEAENSGGTVAGVDNTADVLRRLNQTVMAHQLVPPHQRSASVVHSARKLYSIEEESAGAADAEKQEINDGDQPDRANDNFSGSQETTESWQPSQLDLYTRERRWRPLLQSMLERIRTSAANQTRDEDTKSWSSDSSGTWDSGETLYIGNPFEPDATTLAGGDANASFVFPSAPISDKSRVLPSTESTGVRPLRSLNVNRSVSEATEEGSVQTMHAEHEAQPGIVKTDGASPPVIDNIRRFDGTLRIAQSELSSVQIDSLHNASSGELSPSLNRNSGLFRSDSGTSLNGDSDDSLPLSTSSRPHRIGPFGSLRRTGQRR